jgi:tripartite-type tricarboxylate transporter receptor subunit TctC
MKPVAKRASFIAAAALLCLPAISTSVAAEAFPDQPVRLVIPYPPGGALSITGAIITASAEQHLGQPMVSLIRAGGGGAVGATFAANSKPDGYTLLLGDPSINVIRPVLEKLPYKASDFVPIARITHSPFIFVANKDAPFSTASEMAAYAKANPGKLAYSSDNVNGWTYTAFELFKKAAGVTMRGVEFGGGGPAVTNVLGGNTMAYAGVPSVVKDHIASGGLKAICVSDKERYKPMPDVPTCAESGVNVQWGAWIGVFGHKDTPADRLDKLKQTFAALTKDEGFRTLMGRINADLAYMNASDFDASLQADAKSLR